MNQQINPIHAKAMLDSMAGQLANACANIAARDGTIALQAAQIKELEAKLAELQPKGEA